MNSKALLIWFVMLCVLYVTIELKPRLQFMANGDVWLFVTWEDKRQGIILWYGKV